MHIVKGVANLIRGSSGSNQSGFTLQSERFTLPAQNVRFRYCTSLDLSLCIFVLDGTKLELHCMCDDANDQAFVYFISLLY